MIGADEPCPNCGSNKTEDTEKIHNPFYCFDCGHRWGSEKQTISEEEVGTVASVFGEWPPVDKKTGKTRPTKKR